MGSYVGVVLFSWLLLWSFAVQGDGPDGSLIDFVCQKTGNNALYCLDCLNNTPRTVEVDLKFLGGASINCTLESALVARQSLADYAGNSTGKLQQATASCVSTLDLALMNFAGSQQLWRIEMHTNAIEHIYTGQKDIITCSRALRGVSNSVELIRQIANTVALTEVTVSISSQIPS